MGPAKIDYSRIEIWCDKASDVQLMQNLKELSPVLNQVTSIKVLPSYRVATSQERLIDDPFSRVWPLIEYDRPDYIFCYDRQPFLIVELTEHGYTGDNPLQRFSRIARAAECQVPFIYFSPFARTRYDEIELTDEETSSRKVSARLYQGFVRLSEIYGVPIIAVEWPVNKRGLPSKPPTVASQEAIKAAMREIFGSLMNLIEGILTRHLNDILKGQNILESQLLTPHLETTRSLAGRENTRQSDIRIPNVPYESILSLLTDPKMIFDYLPRQYFHKGKEQKLVALLAIEHSHIEHLHTLNGNMLACPRDRKAIERILSQEFFRKRWTVLFSGYEWRSTPNNGILVNTDIILCRSQKGRTPRDRDQFLVVVWPRVFWNRDSESRRLLLADLQQTSINPHHPNYETRTHP
jgi:hypothetical protein